MIAQDFSSTQAVQHSQSGDIAFVYRVVPSPYVSEELQGLSRVQVAVQIPSASGQTFMGFDYWLPQDCLPLPNAPIAAGSSVLLRDHSGAFEFATVLAAGFDEICVTFEDGKTGWVNLSHVVVDMPLTNRVLAIA